MIEPKRQKKKKKEMAHIQTLAWQTKIKIRRKNAIEGTHFQDSGTEAAARLIDADLIRWL